MIDDIICYCEINELSITSSSDCYYERKITGAYYTPYDVSNFFWNEFFLIKKLNTHQKIYDFIRQTIFVEPAVGAGIFLFSLVKKIIYSNCNPDILKELSIISYDINNRAISFVKKQKRVFEKKSSIYLGGWKFKNKDFLLDKCKYCKGRNILFVGNPPFVINKKGSKWKSSFADFWEKSYAENNADIAFILPLSFTFSRDYQELRDRIINNKSSVYIVNFDNIPDCLFKTKKINSPNSNSANSQRCSVIFCFKDNLGQVFSSKLTRWHAAQRSEILNTQPSYYNISEHSYYYKQFIRPASDRIYRYLKDSASIHLEDLISSSGRFSLNLGSLARNYISFRDRDDAGNHTLKFSKKNDFLIVFKIISSDVFFEYWRTMGDGFHLTKSNIFSFPVSGELFAWANTDIEFSSGVWNKRKNYMKTKKNAGKNNISFDFSGVFTFWTERLSS